VPSPVQRQKRSARAAARFAAAVDDIDFLRRNVRVQWQVKYAGGVLYYAPVKNQEAA
jgi:hypothetical protein